MMMSVVTIKRSLCCRAAILLHRAKADLTLLDENENTALHLACSKVQLQCCKLNVSSSSGNWTSALFLFQRGSLEIVSVGS